MKVYFAADHAGFELKNVLLAYVRDELGYEVEDCGAHEYDAADDYPGIIANAARKLAADALRGSDSKAVILGGSGQGEAIAANRFRGVRAVVYYGGVTTQTDAVGKTFNMIVSTREHNDANALSLGARFLTAQEAKSAVREWLQTPFSGDARHSRRIASIDSQL
jgi:ribose 5-phosphate isomerase B